MSISGRSLQEGGKMSWRGMARKRWNKTGNDGVSKTNERTNERMNERIGDVEKGGGRRRRDGLGSGDESRLMESKSCEKTNEMKIPR